MIVYLDTETGGLEHKHSTLQIALVTEGQAGFSSWIRSDPMVVNVGALAYNGIDLRLAHEWPTKEEVAIELWDWLPDSLRNSLPLIACGFNVRFDVERANELFNAGRRAIRQRQATGEAVPEWRPLFSYRCLDLTAVALFYGLPAKSIELMDWAGVPREPDERHDALDDARKAMLVHLAMQERLLK